MSNHGRPQSGTIEAYERAVKAAQAAAREAQHDSPPARPKPPANRPESAGRRPQSAGRCPKSASRAGSAGRSRANDTAVNTLPRRPASGGAETRDSTPMTLSPDFSPNPAPPTTHRPSSARRRPKSAGVSLEDTTTRVPPSLQCTWCPPQPHPVEPLVLLASGMRSNTMCRALRDEAQHLTPGNLVNICLHADAQGRFRRTSQPDNSADTKTEIQLDNSADAKPENVVEKEGPTDVETLALRVAEPGEGRRVSSASSRPLSKSRPNSASRQNVVGGESPACSFIPVLRAHARMTA